MAQRFKVAFFSLLAGLACSASAASIEWNGFGSAYYGQTMGQHVYGSGLRKSTPEFGRLSKFGLNVGSKVTENFEVAAQLVASGAGFAGIPDSDWDVTTNWAYATFTPGGNFRIRAGRQLFPNFLAAEYIEVNFLQPFRTMPGSVYLISPNKNFDGILVDYTLASSIGSFNFAIWGGGSDHDINTTDFVGSAQTKNFYGFATTLTGDGYKARAQVSTSEVVSKMTSPVSMEQRARPLQYTLGANYDKHNIVVWAEYGNQTAKDSSKGASTTGANVGRYLEHAEGYYVLAGYRFGKFLPRLMYSNVSYQAGIDALYGKEQIYTAGVNYQINENVVAKLDYEVGKIPNATDSPNDGLSIKRETGYTGGDTQSQSVFVGVDFIF